MRGDQPGREHFLLDQQDAEAMARLLPECYHRCNTLEFTEFQQAQAYAMLHLADRYGRVQQVLTELLNLGALPLRRKRTSVLEIGAGPAPALYAVIDFYQALAEWASTVAATDITVDTAGGPLTIATVTDPVALERGPCWDRYLHVLSEQLVLTSHVDAAKLMYRVDHDNLIGFDQPQIHRARLDASAHRIMEEFDRDESWIGWGAARQMAQDHHLGGVSAYDLIVLSNMLTTPDMVDELAPDVERLAHGLTPGGILVIIGSAGAQYGPIWQRITEILDKAPVRELSITSEPIDSHLNPQQAAIIEGHIRSGIDRLRERCSPTVWTEIEPALPRDLRVPGEVFTFPRFRAFAWRRRQ